MTHELVSRRLRTMLVDYLSVSSVLRKSQMSLTRRIFHTDPLRGNYSAGSGALWLTNITTGWTLLLQETRANS